MSEEIESQPKPSNKNTIFIAVGFIFLLLGAVYFFINNSGSKTKFVSFEGDVTIKMGNDEYSPQNISIKKGAKITFVNNSDSLRWPASDLHPSHLIYSEFDSKQPVEKGGSWTLQFDKTGEWGYHDHLAPYITGMIKVSD